MNHIFFKYPHILYLLCLIIIPIIIHIFNFRKYKTLLFSNVLFLKNLIQDKKQKSKLENLLLLAIRILIYLLIVILFAQPYIAKEELKFNSDEVVSIFIDNSFSMNNKAKQGVGIENAKNIAIDIVKSHSEKTKFYINSLDNFENEPLNYKNAIKKIQRIDICNMLNDYNNILLKQSQLFTNYIKKKKCFIISDFQNNSKKNIEYDNTLRLKLIPIVSEVKNNISIDSCWFADLNHIPESKEELFVKITNYSNKEVKDKTIKLEINAQVKALSTIDLKAKESKVIKLSYTNFKQGVYKGKVSLSDFPISFDNNLYFSYQISNSINLLHISEQNNQYIKSLYANISGLKYQHSNYLNSRGLNLNEYSLIIAENILDIEQGLLENLHNYVSNGGILLFIPKLESNFIKINEILQRFNLNKIIKLDTLKSDINYVNYQSDLLNKSFIKPNKNSYMPVIYSMYVFDDKYKDFESILKTGNNKNVLKKYILGKGKIIVSSFEFNKKSSNFVVHPLFVPIMYNMVFASLKSQKLYYTIGDNYNIPLRQIQNKAIKIKSLENSVEFAKETYNFKGITYFAIKNDIPKDGFYNVLNNQQRI